MKKLSVLLAVCILIGVAAAFSGCAGVHEHVYEWSCDRTYHWQECSVENCISKKEKEAHSYEDGICAVCGYEKPAAPVGSKVNEEEWVEILENTDIISNFSSRTGVVVSSEDAPDMFLNGTFGEDYFIDAKFSGSVLFSLEDNLIEYSKDNGDGTFAYYKKPFESDYARYEEDDEFHVDLRGVDIFHLTEKYEMFEYSEQTETYVCKNGIEVFLKFDNIEIELCLYDTAVKFNDGKIEYIVASIAEKAGDEPYLTVFYYNIGTTEVTIPQEIIDGAK